jgi:hypothetical protein
MLDVREATVSRWHVKLDAIEAKVAELLDDEDAGVSPPLSTTRPASPQNYVAAGPPPTGCSRCPTVDAIR